MNLHCIPHRIASQFTQPKPLHIPSTLVFLALALKLSHSCSANGDCLRCHQTERFQHLTITPPPTLAPASSHWIVWLHFVLLSPSLCCVFWNSFRWGCYSICFTLHMGAEWWFYSFIHLGLSNTKNKRILYTYSHLCVYFFYIFQHGLGGLTLFDIYGGCVWSLKNRFKLRHQDQARKSHQFFFLSLEIDRVCEDELEPGPHKAQGLSKLGWGFYRAEFKLFRNHNEPIRVRINVSPLTKSIVHESCLFSFFFKLCIFQSLSSPWC